MMQRRAILLAGMSGLWLPANAGRLVRGSRSGGGGGGYDIAAEIAAVNSDMGVTVTLPTAPTDNGNGGSVTNMSQLTDATNTNGGVFNVAAGSYSGSITLDGQDQKFNFADGFQLAAGSGTVITVTGTARRIHLEGLGAQPSGAAFLGGMYALFGPQDIKFKNLTITTYNNSVDADTIEVDTVTRMLLERCGFTSYRYCAYNNVATDFVIANSQLVCIGTGSNPQATWRSVGAVRAVVIDSRLVNTARHNLRAEGQSNYVYFASNQLEGNTDGLGNGGIRSDDSAGNPNPQVYNGWLRSTEVYAGGIQLDPPPENTVWVATNNTVRSDGSGITIGPDGAWTISGNSTVAYSTPPAWSYQ
jgi:hypothetical protein